MSKPLRVHFTVSNIFNKVCLKNLLYAFGDSKFFILTQNNQLKGVLIRHSLFPQITLLFMYCCKSLRSFEKDSNYIKENI